MNELGRLKAAMHLIETITCECEPTLVLREIYKIAHCFSETCEHLDWQRELDEQLKALDEYAKNKTN